MALWLLPLMGLALISGTVTQHLAGWPAVRARLAAGGSDPEALAAASAGWHFGGAAMSAFGLLLWLAWWELRAGRAGGARILPPIALLYLVYGVCAYFYRHGNPHYLGFSGIGVVIALLWLALRGEAPIPDRPSAPWGGAAADPARR